jgi:hypothetical protein
VENPWNLITVRSNVIHNARSPFPTTVEEYRGISYIVRDANNFPVAYVYFESEPGRRSAANLMTKDEARKIAAGIAKLPELLMRAKD